MLMENLLKLINSNDTPGSVARDIHSILTKKTKNITALMYYTLRKELLGLMLKNNDYSDCSLYRLPMKFERGMLIIKHLDELVGDKIESILTVTCKGKFLDEEGNYDLYTYAINPQNIEDIDIIGLSNISPVCDVDETDDEVKFINVIISDMHAKSKETVSLYKDREFIVRAEVIFDHSGMLIKSTNYRI